MDILQQDRSEGHMRLKIEADEDLWHLRHVVEAGDTLRMDDERTTLEGNQKRRVTLTLEVEKTEYQGNRLRATGEIAQAPEDVEHGYHTFNLEPGVEVDLWKDEWRDYQLDRVKQAAATEAYEVIVCTMDTERAAFHRVTEQGIEALSEVASGQGGKMYAENATSEEEFYEAVTSVLEEYTAVDRIIVAGPGFAKENLVDRVTGEIAEIVTTEDVSSVGEAGVREAIKRGAIDRVLEASRIADETAAVERLLERINTGEAAVYGIDQVDEAVEMGAVDELLITDQMVREHEDLMEQVEQQNGAVQIVHEDHDAGKQLASLGGIAALLRFQID